MNTLAVAPLDCAEGQVPAFKSNAWSCTTPAAPGSNVESPIKAVKTPAGSGLVGGGDTGELSLAVSFSGTGSSPTVAHGDHTHTFTGILGVPSQFADGVDNDTLGALICGDQNVAVFNTSTGLWECQVLSTGGVVEVDPTVNTLAKSAVIEACGNNTVPRRTVSGWTCATLTDADSLPVVAAGCGDGELLSRDSGDALGWTCVTPSVGGQGDITAVVAGSGLVGGSTQGSATLSIDFGSACASGKVACDNGPSATPSLSSVLAVGNDAGAQRIQNVGQAVAPNDAVTKAYVDAAISPGSSESTLALCCGADCLSTFTTAGGWNCDRVGAPGATNANNKILAYLPDQRGVAVVPKTGSLTMNMGASGTTTTLPGSCSDSEGWHVCANRAVSAAQASCGPLNPTVGNYWSCTVAPHTYVWVPGKRGVIYTDGTNNGAANAYLSDSGTATGVTFDCSSADEPVPGAGVKSFLCFR